jgi:hypothetical protein
MERQQEPQGQRKMLPRIIIVLAAGLSLPVARAVAGEPVYPLKVSENRRYFVDQKGRPVFWLGTTQWQLFRDNTREEAETILRNVKGKGFAFVQAMLLGPGDGTRPNVYRAKPWAKVDPLTPNEAYFKNVDAVIQSARKDNVVISLTLYHQRWRNLITVKNARTWAKWLAQRYKDVPTIVWSMTPEAKPEFLPVLRELAAGLRAGDGGRHLITFKPDPAPYSSSFAHKEKWLDFNSMQTWKSVKLIYPMVTKHYQLTPVKPVLMAEGAYEAGSEYGFPVTPLWVRRQAYYSYLCGGHFTYGHNDSWRVLPTWKKALDAPGAVQMGILKKVFLERKEWWYLVPDQSLFAKGGVTAGEVLNLAARHKDGLWIMVYLGTKASFSLNLNKLAGSQGVKAVWINPKTGDAVTTQSFRTRGLRQFSTPEGWEDAFLVVEPTKRSEPRRPAGDVGKRLAPFFQPPAEFAGKLGQYKSPLKFAGGRPVKSAKEWRQRRQEILKTWHDVMGPWPALLARPKIEYIQKERRENLTQHHIRLQVAPGLTTEDAYLLIPDGKGPFPAVLVVFYDASTGVGRSKTPRCDFAYQLARRGFVTLSLGSAPATFYPNQKKAQLQPLSFHAYEAANCHTALASLPQVDAKRIGVIGHSYGGKWAMFAACLYDKFACGVWSDPGIVFDEKRSNVNYWEPWYLGYEPGRQRKPGIPNSKNPRTGAYKRLIEAGHDLHELHALMAPRPFLVSGGSEDLPKRWQALNHAVAVNKFLGYKNRVAMTNRKGHSPTEESNEQIYLFFEHVLK